MKRFAVIVAGGRGLRMNSETPKQFLLLRGLPVLMHTIQSFKRAYADISIILVLPTDHFETWNGLKGTYSFDVPHTLVAGGPLRFDSVKNGLGRCSGEGIVGIHDGVRPLVSAEMIRRCYAEAEKHGSALPTVPITESLRKVQGHQSRPMDRDGIVAVQTPQCFWVHDIINAYEQPYQSSFTDDATVFEAAGGRVHIVFGEETNLKITTAADLGIAEAIAHEATAR